MILTQRMLEWYVIASQYQFSPQCFYKSIGFYFGSGTFYWAPFLVFDGLSYLSWKVQTIWNLQHQHHEKTRSIYTWNLLGGRKEGSFFPEPASQWLLFSDKWYRLWINEGNGVRVESAGNTPCRIHLPRQAFNGLSFWWAFCLSGLLKDFVKMQMQT